MFMEHSLHASVQAYEAEQSFLIHHANAFEDGEDIEVWSSGWGPEALKRLASGSGMLGSWKVVLEGDFTGIPFTALWKHRCASLCHSVASQIWRGMQC